MSENDSTIQNRPEPNLLSGISVIELGDEISAAYCTKIMAYLGADVLKIEKPLVGDSARSVGSFPGNVPNIEKSALFLYLNTGKKSITLNLESSSGQKIFKSLIESVDLVVENLPPGKLESLNLGYNHLSSINPDIVLTSVSDFGQTGPYKNYKATPLQHYAFGGLMYITGLPDREPLQMKPRLPEYGVAQNAFVASLSALWYRDSTGIGQHVDISTAEYSASILENGLSMYSYTGNKLGRSGNKGYGRAAWGIYPCKDGFVGVIAGPEHRWSAMAELMDEPRLADRKFTERSGRRIYAEEIENLMEPWLMSHNKQEIFEQAQKLGLAFAFVATPEDILNWEHLDDRGYLPEISHPDAGSYKYAGAAFQAEGIDPYWQRAPILGEHNDEVLLPIIENLEMDIQDLKLEETI